jgi:hypothetical protein
MGSHGVPLEMLILSIFDPSVTAFNVFCAKHAGFSSRRLRVPTNHGCNLARDCALLSIGESDAADKQKSLAFASELA